MRKFSFMVAIAVAVVVYCLIYSWCGSRVDGVLNVIADSERVIRSFFGALTTFFVVYFGVKGLMQHSNERKK